MKIGRNTATATVSYADVENSEDESQRGSNTECTAVLVNFLQEIVAISNLEGLKPFMAN